MNDGPLTPVMENAMNRQKVKIKHGDTKSVVVGVSPSQRRQLPPPVRYHKNRIKEGRRMACRKRVSIDH